MPLAQLLSCLEAARWAPSASNRQPWRFVYALAGTPAFDRIHAGLNPGNQGWTAQASALVVVLSHRTALPTGASAPVVNEWAAFDAGAAWMSLALQAQASGWVAHAMGGFQAALLRPALGVPDDVLILAVVALGQPADRASLSPEQQARETPNQRKPLSELVAEGQWQAGL